MTIDRSDGAENIPFDDATLYSYIDGELDPSTAAAIRASAEAMARAERLHREHIRLRAAFDRIDCPEADVLLGHATDALSREAAHAVVEHLEHCPLCAQEVEVIASFRNSWVEPELRVAGERLRLIVATLVRGPSFDGGRAPVALRGGEGEPWIFEAGEALVTLVAGVDPELPDRREISAQVTGVDAAGWTAEVWPSAAGGEEGGDSEGDLAFETLEGRAADGAGEDEPASRAPVASATFDDLSTVSMGGLPPGAYFVILRGPEHGIRAGTLSL